MSQYNAKSFGKNPDIEGIWLFLFDTEIINEKVNWTNQKLNAIRKKFKD